MQDVRDDSIQDNSIKEEAREVSRVRAFILSEAGARIIYLTLGAIVIGFIFWWLQFSTTAICCGDFDGYYHVKWSRLLWEGMRSGHFPPTFTWLPLTTLNPHDYVDHHLLFHILQIPFTWFDMRMGAKISAMLFGSLAVFSCYWLIIRYRLSYAPIWLIALLACSAPFLFRMNMTKAMSLSIVLLIAGIYLLFERKYVWLLPLAFVFTLTYDMWALLLAAAFVWAVVLWWSERRIEWRCIAAVAAGVVAGFIINPYFPHNIQLFVEHVKIKVTGSDFSTHVGGEWYPYDSWEFLGNCFVAFVAMVTGYIAFDGSDKKRTARPLFFLIFSTLLLIANARWKRFAEYWPPFAVIFAAFTLQPIFDGVRRAVNRLPSEVMDDLGPFLDARERADVVAAQKREEWWKTFLAASVAVLLIIPLVMDLRAERKEIASSPPFNDYSKGIEWIRKNVPPGQMIFNTDWDDFPKLFYFDPTHSYVSGLDPTYLLDQNPELSKLNDQVTNGKESNPGPIIRDRFGARYIFTDNEPEHDDFYNNAMDSGWFEEVYTDNDCTVLHILDERRTPPADNTDKGNANDNGDEDDNDEGDSEGP